MYPLDTVKTHMQVLRPGSSPTAGISDVIRIIHQESGGRGFMRGCSSIIIGCVPAHIALFSSYEYSKAMLLRPEEDLFEPARAALCGAGATLCHDAILTPMDVVKQRMQLGCYGTVGDCLRSVVRHEGLVGLYRSMPTTLAMNVPFGSILVASNESMKTLLGIQRRTDRASLPWYFLSAGVSGAVASAATQPLDVVKTRLQTQDLLAGQHPSTPSAPSRPSGTGSGTSIGAAASEVPLTDRAASLGSSNTVVRQPKYTGCLPAIRTIVLEEGWLALYKGVLPRMLHSVPSAAMCWGTYETVSRWLRSRQGFFSRTL